MRKTIHAIDETACSAPSSPSIRRVVDGDFLGHGPESFLFVHRRLTMTVGKKTPR